MKRVVQLVDIDFRNNTILAVTRKPDHKSWGFPAGKVEAGEDLLEALEREVKEETNATVKINKIISYEVYDGKEQHAFIGKATPILDRFIAEDLKNGSACYLSIKNFLENSTYPDYNKRILRKAGYYGID